MSQMQSLSRSLLAAGGATSIEGQGIYFLYVENSALISKHWTGQSFGNQELVTNSVLNNSTAAYFITPTTKRIVYISSSFLLRSRVYDEEEEEWVDDPSIGSHKVHPKGHIAGSIVEDPRKQQNILFQDPSRKLVHLDISWKPTILPVNAAEGTPLVVFDDDDTTYVYYVSADDNRLHYTSREQGKGWSDAVFAAHAFEGKEKPKRFLIMEDDEGSKAYILTEGMALRQLPEGGQKASSLGTVNAAGGWVPDTKEECVILVFLDFGKFFGHGRKTKGSKEKSHKKKKQKKSKRKDDSDDDSDD